MTTFKMLRALEISFHPTTIFMYSTFEKTLHHKIKDLNALKKYGNFILASNHSYCNVSRLILLYIRNFDFYRV